MIDSFKSQEYIGETIVSLADVVRAGAKKCKADLKKSTHNRGEVYIAAEEVKDSKVGVELYFKGDGLDKKDFFGKSDPFFKIAR